jgi:hypothetical protein
MGFHPKEEGTKVKRLLGYSEPKRRRSRRAAWLVVSILLIGSVVAASDAWAVTREQAERQLEQAEEAYDRLMDAMSGAAATDVQIAGAMRNVRQWIDHSQDALDRRQYDVSYKLSGQALDRIRGLVTEQQRLDQRYRWTQRFIEQNRESLELLQRRVRLEQVDEKTARMLDMAVDTFHRALDAENRGEVLLAYKLMDQTSDLIKRVIKGIGGQAISRERLGKDLDRTDETVDSVAEALGEAEALGKAEASAGADRLGSDTVLDRARAVQEQARLNEEQGNLDFARRLTLRARTLARLALRLSETEPGTEAERMLLHTDDLIEKYGDMIRGGGEPQAIGLLDNAIALQGEAWDSFNDDRADAALTQTRAAAKLVNAARQRSGS